jgi:hypothetical protein
MLFSQTFVDALHGVQNFLVETQEHADQRYRVIDSCLRLEALSTSSKSGQEL